MLRIADAQYSRHRRETPRSPGQAGGGASVGQWRGPTEAEGLDLTKQNKTKKRQDDSHPGRRWTGCWGAMPSHLLSHPPPSKKGPHPALYQGNNPQ